MPGVYTTADAISRLYDRDPQSCGRQLAGRDQARRTRADNKNIVAQDEMLCDAGVMSCSNALGSIGLVK
jgi:hypothetical protein